MGLLSHAAAVPERVFRRLPPVARKRATDIAIRAFEEVAYLRLAEKGFRPAAIVDVGAYHGDWTRLSQRTFPGTPGLMVEAQQGKAARLEQVRADLPHVHLVNAPLGRTAGQEITFYEMETGSSFFPERSDVGRVERRLKLRTLDDVVAETLGGVGPLFLKVDVQGTELEVLAGGTRTLQACEVVQLEVAVLSFNKGAPTMLDVLGHMDQVGFAPVDVSGLSRPNGRDLVQIDMLFARKDSVLRPEFFTFG